MNWVGDSTRITLPNFGKEIKKASLATGGVVELIRQDDNTVIRFSEDNIMDINTIVELELEGNAMDIPPLEVSAQSVSYGRQTSVSSTSHPRWHPANSVTDGDWVGYYWAPSPEDKTPWIEIDLGKPEKISRAILFEASQSGFLLPTKAQEINTKGETGHAVESFELQSLSGDKWIPFYQGKSIGAKTEISFPQISAQRIRVVITGFSAVPGIYEITLLSDDR